jgi:Tfp pilus assembly protein PilE
MMEILIGLLVIGVLWIAIASFAKARRTIRDLQVTTDLRSAANCFEQYAILNGYYPAVTTPGVVPPGMNDLLSKVNWTVATPLGGQWDWVTNAPGLGKGIRIYMPTATEQSMQRIDQRIDDGNLHSGKFQILEDRTGYLYVVE